jgi:molybdopterin converting factor small subunit
MTRGARGASTPSRSSSEVRAVLAYDAVMPLVRVREPLKRLTGGQSEHAIDGSSVGELLRELERAHPAATGWIHLHVFVNGAPCGQDAHLEADDRIDVVPAISGG